MPQILKRGVLRVYGEEDLFSFYKDEKGFHGFQYELAKAFADKYHLDLDYKSESNFRTRLRLLESGKCDILSGPLPVVLELRNTLAYSVPVFKSKVILLQRKKDFNNGRRPIRDQILLRGKRIAAKVQDPNIWRIHNLAHEISDSIIIREFIGYQSDNLIESVANGVEDYALCDKYVAKAYLHLYPGLDMETPLGFTQFQAWAVKPENKSLLDSLNVFLTEYKKSPAFTRLLEKYSRN